MQGSERSDTKHLPINVLFSYCPTTLESRTLQICDECQILSSHLQGSTEQDADMQRLIKGLRHQLDLENSSIFETPSAAGCEVDQICDLLLAKKLEDSYELLKESSCESEQFEILKYIDTLIQTEFAVNLAVSIGIMDTTLSALKSIDSKFTIYHTWLNTAAIVTSFSCMRGYLDFLYIAIRNLHKKDVHIQELSSRIIFNFTQIPKHHFKLGQMVLAPLIGLIEKKESLVLIRQSIASIANLTINAANRKVFEAWGGLSCILPFFESPEEDMKIGVFWILSHMCTNNSNVSFCHQYGVFDAAFKFAFDEVNLGLKIVAMRTISNAIITSSPCAQELRNKTIASLGLSSHAGELSLLELNFANLAESQLILSEQLYLLVNLTAKNSFLAQTLVEKHWSLLKLVAKSLASTNYTLTTPSLWLFAYLSRNIETLPKLQSLDLLDKVQIISASENDYWTLPLAWIFKNFTANSIYISKLKSKAVVIFLVKNLFSRSDKIQTVVAHTFTKLFDSEFEKNVKKCFPYLSASTDLAESDN